MRSRAQHLRIVVAVLAATFLACDSGSSNEAFFPSPSPCPEATPVADTSRIPKGVPLSDWGTIIRIEHQPGFVGALAVGHTQIVELYPVVVRTLRENGFTLLGGDNEGFEAEISFIDRDETYYNFLLREDNCEDQILIRMLVEQRKRGNGGGKQ